MINLETVDKRQHEQESRVNTVIKCMKDYVTTWHLATISS